MTENVDEAATRDWYIATFNGHDVVNVQFLTKISRPGQHVRSRAPRGFRIFQRSTDICNFGYSRSYLPWLQIWKVQPLRAIRYESAPQLTWITSDPTLLRARSIQIVEKMPDGAQFGRHGQSVWDLMHHLAALDELPPEPGRSGCPSYDAAMYDLGDRRTTPLPSPQWEAEKLAIAAFRRLYSHVHRRTFDRSRQDISAMIRAVIADGDLPLSVTEYWQLPPAALVDSVPAQW